MIPFLLRAAFLALLCIANPQPTAVDAVAEFWVAGKQPELWWPDTGRSELAKDYEIKDGENTLEVNGVSLRVNRMIGDEQLPEDSARHPVGGTLIAWQKWLLDGKPSPTGRFTFCTTKLWNKDEPLVESGLLGPVRLEAAK